MWPTSRPRPARSTAAWCSSSSISTTAAPWGGTKPAARGLLPTGIYPAADGWLQIATPPPYADRLVATLNDPGLADLFDDPAWVTNPEVPDLVEGALYGWLAERTTAEAMAEAQPHHWPVTAVADHPGGPGRRPVPPARDVFVTLDHPVAGAVVQPGPPIRFADLESISRPAPVLGEHSEEIRAELASLAPPPGPIPPAAGRRLPLEGVRVLDLTMVWAGPYTTMLLGDLGADVIRVEDARLYNGTRGALPRPPREQLDALGWLCAYPDDDPGERPWNRNAFFNIHARNKRSATVNLVRPEGREAFLRLVEKSDVLVENNAVGVMDKLGLSWEQLHERNDQLIMLRMPALGLTGPRCLLCGVRGQLRSSVRTDLASGLHRWRPDADRTRLLHGYRQRSGRARSPSWLPSAAAGRGGAGELVELAQGENMLNLIGEYLIDAGRRGEPLPPPGNRHLTDAPQGTYPCTGTDRWVVLSVDSDHAWGGLRRAMGSPSWADDERFVTAAGRRRHHDELDEHLTQWTASLDRWEVTRRCQAEGVIAGPVLDDADAAGDPQLRARGFFRPNGSDEVGWHDYPSHLWRWDGPEMRHEGLCPFAAANDDVWRQLVDLDEAALAALDANGHLLDHFVDADGNPL